jgi:hypothetical protein
MFQALDAVAGESLMVRWQGKAKDEALSFSGEVFQACGRSIGRRWDVRDCVSSLKLEGRMAWGAMQEAWRVPGLACAVMRQPTKGSKLRISVQDRERRTPVIDGADFIPSIYSNSFLEAALL